MKKTRNPQAKSLFEYLLAPVRCDDIDDHDIWGLGQVATDRRVVVASMRGHARTSPDFVQQGVDFDSKSLILAVPSGSGSPAQLAVLADLKNYAMNNGIFLDIRGVK